MKLTYAVNCIVAIGSCVRILNFVDVCLERSGRPYSTSAFNSDK